MMPVEEEQQAAWHQTNGQHPAAAEAVQPRIIIDTREERTFDEYLKGRGAAVERKMLAIGDFICSERSVVERKTRSDFEQSVIDGRLFSQLHRLTSSYGRVVLVVEGEAAEGRIDQRALLGAYSSIITDFGAAVFFTRNGEKTAELIYSIARHEQRTGRQLMRVFAKRKTHTAAQTQRAIIEALPLIGPKLAISILDHFGTIESFVRAGENELLEVPGMGQKRAKLIKKILTVEYSWEEDKPLII